MDSRTKCLCCHYWLRTKDPLVGWCQAFGEWRGQFEGFDRELGACQRYVFGEERERSGFTELPKPKRVVSGHWTPVIEQNIERIRAWKAEGRSYAWMAQKLGVPIRSSSLVSRFCKAQEVKE